MITKSFMKTMSDGAEVWVNRWAPDAEEEIRGVVELHHGLAEHSMRYDRLGSVLAENGYVLSAHDMRGHGRTAENAASKGTGKFGKLADRDGFERVVEDLRELVDSLKAEYPGKKTVLIGHSFGSFVSQGYIERYGGSIDGCILCGTAGPRPALVFCGKLLANLYRIFRGADTEAEALHKAAFGAYTKKIDDARTEYDWLSADSTNVGMFMDDSWCGRTLTASFFCDMMHGLSVIHSGKAISGIPADLPLLLIYGSDDPVGGYGKSVRKLYDVYRRHGIRNLSIKEYAGDRHEILNEKDKEQVEGDIMSWISGIQVK